MLFKPYYQGKKTDHFDGRRFFLPGAPFTHSFVDLLKWRFCETRSQWPQIQKILTATNVAPPLDHGQLRITCIGHATVLIQSQHYHLLTDPQFSNRTGPYNLGPARVQPPGVSLQDLPTIHAIFISHNHYDHLDLPSLKWIWQRDQPLFITPLGNETTLKKIDKAVQILSLDWFASKILTDNVSVQVLPTQHWSSRTIFDRDYALWGSACFSIDHRRVLFLGDSGFNKEVFQKIKQILKGTLDVAILPIGCYSPRWFMQYAHMSPEDAWEAFIILQGTHLIPIHYDVFPLGDEPYGEALTRLYAAAGQDKAKIAGLNPGKYFEI